MDGLIPVNEQPEPQAPEYDFHHDVYERGEDAVRSLAGLKPLRSWENRPITARVASIDKVTHAMLRDYPYWTRAMPALHRAYQGRCAYLARYIEPVEGPTTDHFVALHSTADRMLAYTWSNYRLAHALVNGAKKDFSDVLDPFEVGEGWFALDLGSFKTEPGPLAPPERRDEIVRTIVRLKLDGPEIAETRRRAATRYWTPPAGKPPLPLWCLEQDEPFLASELRRQNRLRDEDR